MLVLWKFLIAFLVVVQPADQPAWLDWHPRTATRVRWATSTVLLSHRATEWQLLDTGDILVFEQQTYCVTQIHTLTALEPTNPYGDFIEGEKRLSSNQVAERFYYNPGWLVLQTCVGIDGRMWVVAEKCLTHLQIDGIIDLL